MRTNLAHGVEDRVIEARVLLRFAKALLVRLDIREIERISGAKPAVNQFVARLQQQVQPLLCADLEVVLALGADIHVGFKVGLPDGLAAPRAFDPQALRADTLLLVAVLPPGPSNSPFSRLNQDISLSHYSDPESSSEFAVQSCKPRCRALRRRPRIVNPRIVNPEP